MSEPGRREAHKRATRATILASARRLFAERGYDGTTVRDIAAAAQITERTFFRYFASKDDLAVDELLGLLPALTEAIARRPSDEPPLTAVRRALPSLPRDPDGPLMLLFSGPPALRRDRPAQTQGRTLFRFEGAVADALATRPGGEDRYRAEVLARAAVAALRSAFIAYHLAGGAERVPLTELATLVDRAFTVLEEPGIPG